MQQSLYLAFTYLKFHKVRSLVLVFSIGLILYLPAGLKKLISESEALMLHRAETTPLIVGAKGSSTDLAINALYFHQEITDPIPMKVLGEVNATGLGYGIPIVSMFKARNFPIVGTDPEYFHFRGLGLAAGRWMGYIGECVIGSEVASDLNVGVGDSLVSSPENYFDLAGVYPLKMNVVGVMAPTDSPDDKAVFVDVKTNWVIMGLGHGHEDVAQIQDPTIITKRDTNEVQAGAKLRMQNAISAGNLDSFHFHGNMGDYPLNAMIFVPRDQKSATIFQGRFASGDLPNQVIVPKAVIDGLLQRIFKIKQLLNAVFLLVGVATISILSLIFMLSICLRKDEIYTMFTIGSGKGKVAEIILLEMVLLLAGSVVFSGLLYAMTGMFVEKFINTFII